MLYLLIKFNFNNNKGNLINNFEGSKLPFPLPTINIYNTLKEQECAICIEPLLNEESSSYLRQLTCGHTFHEVCTGQANCDGWMRFNNGKFSKNPCPLCREVIQRVGDLFIDEKSNNEKIQITLAHGRGALEWGVLFVDENTKMKKIMETCCRMLGQDTTYSLNDQPRPFLVEYEHNIEYSPSLDLNEDITLQTYGIKNGDCVTVSHTFKYI